MSSSPQARRSPISRRLMLALFLLMIVPVCGWYFIAEFASRELLGTLPEATRSALLEVQGEIRFKLALILGLSLVVLGGVLAWLRRAVLEPLEDLAARARDAGQAPWTPPPQLRRPDEVGDLARTLDCTVQRLEQRAQQAESFAADLSHQLRTPLTAIRGAAEILLDPELPDGDRQRFLRHILTESERLRRLVSGMLALARLEGGSGPESGAPLALTPLVRELVDSCSPLLAEADQYVEIDQQPDLPAVQADRDAVARVMLALLENAIHHSPPDTTIKVALRSSEGQLEVAVDDCGPGVPLELREQVFERQFTRSRGTGLGLAIARSLIEGHGGRIWVEESPHGGASFRFTLPVSEPP